MNAGSIRAVAQKIYKRLRRSHEARATEADIYFCYRLLLDREPDRSGLESWKEQVARFSISVPALVQAFMSSPEFKSRQAAQDRPVVVNLPDFKILVAPTDYLVGSLLARGEEYEPVVQQEVRRHLREGDTFLDVGANIGFFSCLGASVVGPRGKVFAFEPNPKNVSLLYQNIALNEFLNVEVLPYALGPTDGFVSFDVTLGTTNGAVVRDPGPGAFKVRTIRLDTFDRRPRQARLLKIDVEGYESAALSGMAEFLIAARPVVIMEFSPEYSKSSLGISGTELLTQVASYGYALYIPTLGAEPRLARAEECIRSFEKSGASHIDLLLRPCV